MYVLSTGERLEYSTLKCCEGDGMIEGRTSGESSFSEEFSVYVLSWQKKNRYSSLLRVIDMNEKRYL